MAKKPTEVPVPKVPFSVGDRGAYIRKAHVAIEVVQVPTYECVVYSIPYDRVETMSIPVSEMDASHDGQRRQFYVEGHHVSGGPAQLVETHLAWLRERALQSGATPDAIRLLSKVTGKFTKKEETEMAEKLKSKAAPKKADKEGLKAAASKTPVGGEKKKGNADALKKAREAKGPDTRKVKALVKPKDLKAREGTARRKMLEDLLASKTVQEFRDKGYSAGDLNYAIGADIVSVS